MAARVGGSSGANPVDIPDLAEFRRYLRTLDDPRAWSRRLGAVNRQLAKDAVGWARAEARSMGGPQRHFANRIAARGGVTGARITINKSEANAAFWGAMQRSGWYVHPRYNGSRGQQHPDWVGNTWDVAAHGQGPYAINPALADHLPEITEAYLGAFDHLAREAGFHR